MAKCRAHRKISKGNFFLSHLDFYDNPVNSMIEMKMPWWGMAVKGVLGRGKPRQPHGKVGARLALESISSSPNLQSFDGSQLSSEPCKSILVYKLTSIDAPYVTHVLYSCNSCVPVSTSTPVLYLQPLPVSPSTTTVTLDFATVIFGAANLSFMICHDFLFDC